VEFSGSIIKSGEGGDGRGIKFMKNIKIEIQAERRRM